MNTKPLIAITPSLQERETELKLNRKYAEAVGLCGGIPVVLCYDSIENSLSALEHLHGIIFSGGNDIDPLLFQEEPIVGNGEISPVRDAFELEMCKKALSMKIPMLGICRGMQIMAVADGGSVIQDIYSLDRNFLKHVQMAPTYYPTHSIEITEGSRLHHIVEDTKLQVNSFHHQAVSEKTGEHFRVCARSSDGVIEAIEHCDLPFAMGLQWHPECLFERNSLHLRFFEELVQAAIQRI